MSHFDITAAQPSAWSILSRSFRSGKVASTYLLHGPEGLGQWLLALNFTALLNCQEPVETGDPERPARPCSTCRNCRAVFDLNFEGFHPVLPIPSHKSLSEAIDLTNETLHDLRQEPFRLLTSTAALSIPIAMAREVTRRLSRKSDEGITRVVLFYRMEKMKTAAADALLKLIEEPPPDTVVILTAGRPEMLLPTIQSRTQKVKLNRIPEELMVDYLTEEYEMGSDQAKLAARLSDGVMGRAVDMSGGIDDEGQAQRETAMDLFRSMFLDPSPVSVASICDRVNPRDRGSADELLRVWQSLARDAHYFAVSNDAGGMTNVDFASKLKELAPCFAEAGRTDRILAAIKNTLADFSLNVHIHTALAALSLQLKSVAEDRR